MKIFKKVITYILLIALSFSFNIYKGDAASLSVSISSNSNRVVVGNYVTYTVKVSSSSLLGVINYSFKYDSSKLTLVSGTLNNVIPFRGTEKSATYTFKFKAKASGNATVSFVLNEAIDFNGNPFSVNKTTSKTTSIITQAELEASYSKNNYLSNLKVDGYDISPAFNKNTLEYSLTLENDVRSINVSGSRDDSTSSVTGLGKHELNEGINKIEVRVTAQNGSTRTYILNVTVKELAPIIVEVDGQKYNVIRKKELITAPNSKYEDTIIKINNEDVPAFINDVTKVTLVGLKDDEGNIALYSYNNGAYTKYKEFAFNKIIVTESVLDEVPKGYKETKITINEKELTAYQNDDSSNFYLIFATNIENGTANLYQYDSKENTIQLFNEKEKNSKDEIEEKNKYYEYIIIGLGSLLAVTYVYLLISIIRKGNRKKDKQNKKKKNIVDENIVESSNNFTKSDDNIEVSLEEKKKVIENNDKIEENISYKEERKTVKKKKK